MGAYGSIDTDAAIGTILSHFDSDYIYHIVEDSITYRFRPFNTSMANIVDVMNRQFIGIEDNSQDYIEKVKEVKSETFIEIIKIICNKYNLKINVDLSTLDENYLFSLTHILYDLFVSRFTDYMFNFFVSYIINNADSIYSYLMTDDTVKKSAKDSGAYKKFIVNQKYVIICANMNKILYNMISYGITFEEIINICLDKSSAEFILSNISDAGDFYKSIYVPYIYDNRYLADSLSNIRLLFQQRTYEFVVANNN